MTGGRDVELVQRLLNGDEESFSALVTEYHGKMLRLARMFVSSQAVAEEVVQEVWVAVLGGLAKFEGRSSLKTWIFRILTNRAKTRGVREGRTVPFSALGSEDDAGGPDAERFASDGKWQTPPSRWGEGAPEKLLQDKQARASIEKAIEGLPDNQRAVITLRDVQGWTSEEVCDLLEVTEVNQRVLLHRARTKIRKQLEKHWAD